MDGLFLPYSNLAGSADPIWIEMVNKTSSTFFACPISSNTISDGYYYTAMKNTNMPSTLKDIQSILDGVGAKYPRLAKISLSLTFKVNYYPSGATRLYIDFGMGSFTEVMSSHSLWGMHAECEATSTGSFNADVTQVFQANVDKIEYWQWDRYVSTWYWYNDITCRPKDIHDSYKKNLNVQARINSLKISILR